MRKTIVITGCSSGFGRQSAEQFARLGHRVYAGMRDPSGRNAEVASALRKNKGSETLFPPSWREESCQQRGRRELSRHIFLCPLGSVLHIVIRIESEAISG